MIFASEDLKKMNEIQGTSAVEKNRLYQLKELFRQADPLSISRELDELLSALFFYANMASDQYELGPKEAQQYVYNVKCIKDMLLNVYQFEQDLAERKHYFVNNLKEAGLIQA